MKIACIECGEPVHGTVYKCPHCGKLSGAAKGKATPEEIATIAHIEKVKLHKAVADAGKGAYGYRHGVPGRDAGGGFGLIGAVVEAAVAIRQSTGLSYVESPPVASEDSTSRDWAHAQPPPRAATAPTPRAATTPPPRAATTPPPPAATAPPPRAATTPPPRAATTPLPRVSVSELPTATVRAASPAVSPIASKAPEPPPTPSDQPRFLK